MCIAGFTWLALRLLQASAGVTCIWYIFTAAKSWTTRLLTDTKLCQTTNRRRKMLQSDWSHGAGCGLQTSRHLIKLNLNLPWGIDAKALHHLSLLKHFLATDNEAHTLSMRGIYDWWPVWAGSFRLMRGNYPSWQVVWCHRVMNLEVRPQKRHIFHLFCRRGYSRTPETTVLREGSLLYLPNSEFVRQNGNVQQLEEWGRWFSSQNNREEKWWHWLAPWIRQRLSITEQL